MIVLREVAKARMAVCRECPSFRPALAQCRECGCFMHAKTALEFAQCPLGKWGKYDGSKWLDEYGL